MIARRSVWSDPKVVELLSNFIPSADEVAHLQTGADPECRLFQEIAEQGHYAGRTVPTNTRQGTYAAAPSGVLLASINSNDPVEMASMLREALAKWKTLSREERLLSEDPRSKTGDLQNAVRFYPQDGLVLRVNSRDLPRSEDTGDWRAKAWNQDYAWFTKEEARRFLPEKIEVGQKSDLPDALIRRLARCHLVDNVRGQTRAFDEKDISKAHLTSTVVGVEGSVASLRLEGESRIEAEGVWSISGFRDMNSPSSQKRGFDSRLLGNAKYDLKQERFVAFEMAAIGSRWGGTQYNGRNDDLQPSPMGIAFTLAGNSDAERVAPAFFWAYGWE